MYIFIRILAELHGDLFSHPSSSEDYVVVAVYARGEHVVSDELFRRCNGKSRRRSVAAEV